MTLTQWPSYTNLTRIPWRLTTYWICKHELPLSRLWKVIIWQKDRETWPILYNTLLRLSVVSTTHSPVMSLAITNTRQEAERCLLETHHCAFQAPTSYSSYHHLLTIAMATYINLHKTDKAFTFSNHTSTGIHPQIWNKFSQQ